METSIKSSAINYGLYLGGFLATSTILAYAFYLDLFTKWWYGIGLMLIIIVLGVFSAIKSKSTLNGFISFKDAFASYFIPIAKRRVMWGWVGGCPEGSFGMSMSESRGQRPNSSSWKTVLSNC